VGGQHPRRSLDATEIRHAVVQWGRYSDDRDVEAGQVRLVPGRSEPAGRQRGRDVSVADVVDVGRPIAQPVYALLVDVDPTTR